VALAITMWDHSVFSRRWGREDEFADWERRLDELADRGYDCVRIDAWPHLIDSDRIAFTLEPQRPRWMWGNHSRVEIRPKEDVPRFVELAAERGMRVGLSSWFQPDVDGHRARVRRPEDYARVWERTLEHLAELHHHVAWVDLCNEFPLALWSPSAWRDITGARWPDVRPLMRRWTPEARATMERYFAAIDPLRGRWPELRYTFSFQGLFGGANFRRLDLSRFDVLKPHVWLSNDKRFALASGQWLSLAELPGSAASHRVLGPLAWRASRRTWRRALSRRLGSWARCAERHGLALLTTEGWASTMYDDAPRGNGAEWRWVKEACETAVGLALDEGWAGVCTSNFCQPLFPGMWDDVGWHRRLTDAIRRAPATLDTRPPADA